MLAHIQHLEAGRELSVTHGVAGGIALAMDGKNVSVQAAQRHLIEAAYPETTDD